MTNGIAKNLEVVKGELRAFAREQKRNIKRLSKPSLNPKNREHFVPHVLTAVIEETYDTLPRTLTYITVAALIGTTVVAIINT